MTYRYYDGRPFARFDDPRKASLVSTFLFTDRAPGALWEPVPAFTEEEATNDLGMDIDLSRLRRERDVRFLADWGFTSLRPCPFVRCLDERPVFPNFKGGPGRTHCTRECWKADEADEQARQRVAAADIYNEVRQLRADNLRLRDELTDARFAAEDLRAALAAAEACLEAAGTPTAPSDPALDALLSAPALALETL